MPEFAREYIEARRALLDVLAALGANRASVIVAGAQAVYLRTGQDADLPGVQPYTTDADIALDPTELQDVPTLEQAMRSVGFRLDDRSGADEPGIWIRDAPSLPDGFVEVDLIVPTGFAPPEGRRGVRLGVHGSHAARKVPGMEAVVVDHLGDEEAGMAGNANIEYPQDPRSARNRSPSGRQGRERRLSVDVLHSTAAHG